MSRPRTPEQRRTAALALLAVVALLAALPPIARCAEYLPGARHLLPLLTHRHLARHRAAVPATAVVVVGASVAQGYRAGPGDPWPGRVAARLRAARLPVRMVDAAVGGARLLTTGEAGQPSALAREARDALAVPGVRTVVVTDLINDIQQPPHQYDPAVLVAGLETFADRAHARGVRVVATTIPPYGGYVRWQAAGERCRRAVNAYLRGSRRFDAVLDFDAVLRDPADPARLRPAYDSGDHLHPGDLGHGALAEAVDLARLTGR